MCTGRAGVETPVQTQALGEQGVLAVSPEVEASRGHYMRYQTTTGLTPR
jgi:hypothetical protein